MDDNCVQILLGQWDNFGTVSWCEDEHPAKRQLLWGKPRHTSCTLRRHWSTTFKSLSPMKLDLWKTHNRSQKALVILRWKPWPAKPFIVAAVVGRPFRCQFRAVATGKVHGQRKNGYPEKQTGEFTSVWMFPWCLPGFHWKFFQMIKWIHKQIHHESK